MKALLYCQQVLGIGHLFRSLEIARALEGWDVAMITGGPRLDIPFPEPVREIRLPGLMMDPEFQELSPVKQGVSLEAVREARKARLFDIFESESPDVFIVELFPFGRGSFRFELEPVLEAIALGRLPSCRVVCSLRDILVEKADPISYENRVIDRLNRFFDALLIHADPDLIPLSETFGRLDDINIPITYTGFVTRRPDRDARRVMRRHLGLDKNHHLTVTSAGGGRVGFRLLEATLSAFRDMDPDRFRLQLFSGPHITDEDFERLMGRAGPAVRIERFTDRFLSYLAAADLSISMAGYNTSMNVLASQVPALVQPFAQNREQRMRAEALARLGAVRVLEDADLEPACLRRIIESMPRRRVKSGIDLDGAHRTAEWLNRWLVQSHPAGPVSVLWRRPAPDPDGWIYRVIERAAARPGAGETARFFFRADDVGVPGPNFTRLMEIFRRHRAPLALAVVPAWLTAARWKALKSLTRGDDGLYGWHQHGWRHVNHEAKGRKREFGEARSREQQRQDILRGRRRLERLMAEDFTPFFTPPWNRCSTVTLEILRDLGYYGVSRSIKSRPSAPDGLPDFPIGVDLHTRGESEEKAAWNALALELEYAVFQGPCGIMIHHQRMNEEAFHFLDVLLEVLNRHPGIELVDLRHLARQPGEKPA